MKILQINKYFFIKGGAETVFFNTIELLEKNGHEVIPFSTNSPQNKNCKYSKYFVNFPELRNSSIKNKIKHSFAFFYNREAARKLEQLILKEKPEIAHIHLMFNSLSVSILPILKKHNIPIIMSVHDYRLICPAYTFKNNRGKICEKCKSGFFLHCILNKCSGNRINSVMLCLDSYFRKYTFSPIKYIDKFIFVSKFSQLKHTQIQPLYKDKSVQLYNFTPNISEPKNRKGNYFVYVGRLSYEKGIETLISAMEYFPNTQLKIIGNGPLLNTLKKKASPNITFEGFKEGEELKKYIYNSSFSIIPSEWYENNPLSIIESMALGTPVIGSNIGGIPELIHDSISGYLFRAGDIQSLKQILNKAINLDNEDYSKMSQAAILFAKRNFSSNLHYQKLISLYQSTINFNH